MENRSAYAQEYWSRPANKERKLANGRLAYVRNRQHILGYKKAAQEVQRRRADSLKDMPCAHCGRKFAAPAMEWHHVNPNLKSLSIGSQAGNIRWARVIEEIAKCDLLCSCCHRLIESGDYGG